MFNIIYEYKMTQLVLAVNKNIRTSQSVEIRTQVNTTNTAGFIKVDTHEMLETACIFPDPQIYSPFLFSG